MAGIYKRGNTWYAKFYVNGEIARVSTGVAILPKGEGESAKKNEKLAKSLAEQLEREAKGEASSRSTATLLRKWANTYDETPTTTAKEFFESYTPSGGRSNNNNSKRAYKLFLEYLDSRHETGIALADIDYRLCMDFLGEQLQHVTKGTVGNYRGYLLAAFKDAMRNNLISKNPVSLFTMREVIRNYSPEGVQEDETTRQPFTIEEVQLIMTRASRDWQDLFCLSLFTGGQRLGDCCQVLWKDVDFTAGTIRIFCEKTKNWLENPLHDELRHRLEARRAERKNQDEKFIFPSFAREYKRTSALSTKFIIELQQLGIDVYGEEQTKVGRRRRLAVKSFHSIRHTVVRILRSSNKVSADVSRAVVNHKSEAIEQEYYTASREDKANALHVLAQAIAL